VDFDATVKLLIMHSDFLNTFLKRLLNRGLHEMLGIISFSRTLFRVDSYNKPLIKLYELARIRVISGSARKQMKAGLFWVITPHVVVIHYRRFGKTYRPHLQGSRILERRSRKK